MSAQKGIKIELAVIDEASEKIRFAAAVIDEASEKIGIPADQLIELSTTAAAAEAAQFQFQQGLRDGSINGRFAVDIDAVGERRRRLRNINDWIPADPFGLRGGLTSEFLLDLEDERRDLLRWLGEYQLAKREARRARTR